MPSIIFKLKFYLWRHFIWQEIKRKSLKEDNRVVSKVVKFSPLRVKAFFKRIGYIWQIRCGSNMWERHNHCRNNLRKFRKAKQNTYKLLYCNSRTKNFIYIHLVLTSFFSNESELLRLPHYRIRQAIPQSTRLDK